MLAHPIGKVYESLSDSCGSFRSLLLPVSVHWPTSSLTIHQKKHFRPFKVFVPCWDCTVSPWRTLFNPSYSFWPISQCITSSFTPAMPEHQQQMHAWCRSNILEQLIIYYFSFHKALFFLKNQNYFFSGTCNLQLANRHFPEGCEGKHFWGSSPTGIATCSFTHFSLLERQASPRQKQKRLIVQIFKTLLVTAEV